MQIHTVDLEFQGQPKAIAAFLVESGDTRILFETGPESTRANLLTGLESLGCRAADLSAIFVTHIHLDHAGAAGWFAKEGIPVYVHEKGAKHLIDPTRLIESARQVYGDRFDSLWGEMQPAPADHIHPLTGNEMVKLSDLEVEVIATPGHAFHHHAYVIDGTCFAGDSAGARLEGSDYISVTSAPPQFHLEHTLNSIETLAKQGFEALYLTHFGVVPDVTNHLSAYRETVELNVEFIRQRLEEKMDPDSLQIAYQAFNMEQAFRSETPQAVWKTLQLVNSSEMCADGIRLYWEKQEGEGA